MASEVAVYDGDTGEMVERDQVVAIEAITRAEMGSAIHHARQFPRSIARFRSACKLAVESNPQIAASCSYAKPIGGGKFAIGPSVRLAEIVARNWGNCTIGTRIIDISDRFVTVQGVGVDHETGYRVTDEVQRQITDSKGRRYSENMIAVTAAAARSIAFRNITFRLLDLSTVEDIRLMAVAVANGGQSTEELLAKLFAHFATLGVDEKRVCLSQGAAGRADLKLDNIETLRAIATAIREGETSVESAFPKPEGSAGATPASTRTEGLKERLDAKGSKPEPAAKS